MSSLLLLLLLSAVDNMAKERGIAAIVAKLRGRIILERMRAALSMALR